MNIHQLCQASVVIGLAIGGSLRASGILTVDFEDLSDVSELQLTDQIPGLLFEAVTAMTLATVGTSTGPDLTVGSGSSAASTFGARIHFTRPVVQVTMRVLPSFIAVNGTASYLHAYLRAYPKEGQPVLAKVPVIVSVRKAQDIRNVRPSIVSVSASSPIQYVTLDFDDPWDVSGTRLVFDDLELTIVEPPIPPPPLMIRRIDGDLGLQLPDHTPSPRVEYTTDLSSGRWHEWTHWRFDASSLSAQGTNSMFFRAKWRTPIQEAPAEAIVPPNADGAPP